jgi:hypothetical protein
MTDQNVCPYCGCGADAYRQQIFNAAAGMHTYRFIGECVECGASGPDCDTAADAIHAFCNPAHLMQGKVMVSKDDLESLLTMHDCGACCGDIDEIANRLRAAIDAASKEGE